MELHSNNLYHFEILIRIFIFRLILKNQYHLNILYCALRDFYRLFECLSQLINFLFLNYLFIL